MTAASWIGWAVGFVLWILVIAWTAAIARRKGRSPFLWGLLAFFISLFALILVLLMPSKKA